MLTDGLKLIGTSATENLIIEHGSALPTAGMNLGELFYQTGVGLHIYDGSAWSRVTPDTAVSSGANLPGSGTAGQLFVKTGDGLYISNGSTWSKVSSTYSSGANLPASGSTGDLFYQTGVGLMVYNGTGWVRTSTTSGANLPSSASTGDLFYKTGTGLMVYNGSAWVRSSTSAGANLPATSGATTGDLFYQTGVGLMVYNGTAWVAVAPAAPATPYDIAGSIFGKPSAPSLVFRFICPRSFSLPAGLTGSYASTSTVATGATVLNIYKNGSVIGTINFAAGATNATFTFSSLTSFAAGDLLTVGYPTADSTFGDAQFTLAATLT